MIHIKKVKLQKETTVHVEYHKQNDDDSSETISKDCTLLAHPDLTDALDELVPHLIELCDLKEMIKGRKLTEYELSEIDHIKVSGVTFINGADPGCVITGQKRIGEKILNLNTPLTLFNERYRFMKELQRSIIRVKEETVLYIGGKCRNKQLSLDMEEVNEDVF